MTKIKSNEITNLKDNKQIELYIRRYKSDNVFFKYFTFITAVISICLTLAMIIYLIVEASKLGSLNGSFNLFSDQWNIVSQETTSDGHIITKTAFGGLTSLVGSIYTVLGAMIIGIPLGILTSVIIAKYTFGIIKIILNQLIALFAGIPSVVWGFFGVAVLVPLFTNNPSHTGQGEGLLVSILVLALMIIPTIVNISVNSLDNVDKDFIQASYALGNTKNQTVYRIVLPSARRGIIVGCILGVGKALGEGIALSMICGNLNVLPTSLFSSFNTMTTLIFSNFGNAQPVERQALFLVGVILFVFIIIINLLINILSKDPSKHSNNILFKKIIGLFRNNTQTQTVYKTKDLSKKVSYEIDFSKKKNFTIGCNILFVVSLLFSLFTFVCFLYVIFYILINGLPIMNAHITQIFNKDNLMVNNYIGLGSQITTTLIMVGLTLVICVPIGILTAIYLAEYASKDSQVIKFIRFCIQVLAGAPGILIGLLGYSLFISSRMFGNSYSIIAGILTLSIMCLPTVINTTENSLRSVPQEYIDASTALGMTKSKTIISIILPQSLSGIFSAIILTIGKVVAESAALIFTSGTQNLFTNLYSSGASLAVSMYMFVRDGTNMDSAFVCGVLIIIIVILINLIMLVLQIISDKIKTNSSLFSKRKKKIVSKM